MNIEHVSIVSALRSKPSSCSSPRTSEKWRSICTIQKLRLYAALGNIGSLRAHRKLYYLGVLTVRKDMQNCMVLPRNQHTLHLTNITLLVKAISREQGIHAARVGRFGPNSRWGISEIVVSYSNVLCLCPATHRQHEIPKHCKELPRMTCQTKTSDNCARTHSQYSKRPSCESLLFFVTANFHSKTPRFWNVMIELWPDKDPTP